MKNGIFDSFSPLKIKKLLAVVLTAAMVFSMIPQNTAMAGSEDVQGGHKRGGSYTELCPGEEYEVNIDGENASRWFTYTPETTGWYTLSSTGDHDTVARLYEDPKGSVIEEDDDAGENNTNFNLDYILEAGKTYYYEVAMYVNDTEGSFKVKFTLNSDRKVISSAKISIMPRTVFYNDIDKEIDYSGLAVDITLLDGTTETAVYGDDNVEVKSNVKKSKGKLNTGTWHADIYYNSQKITEGYDFAVKEFAEEELWDGTIKKDSVNYGNFYKYRPSESGYYLLKVTSESDVKGQFNIDAQETGAGIFINWSDTVRLEGNVDSYCAAFLEADTDYRIKYHSKERESQGKPYSIVINKCNKDKLTNVKGAFNYIVYTPEKTGVYDFEIKGVTEKEEGFADKESINAYNLNQREAITECAIADEVISPAEGDAGYNARYCESYVLEKGKDYMFCVYSYDQGATYSLGIQKSDDIEVTENAPVTATFSDNETISFEAQGSCYYRMTLKSDSENGAIGLPANTPITDFKSNTRKEGNAYCYELLFYCKGDSSLIVKPLGLTVGDEFTLSVKQVPKVVGAVVKTLPVKTIYDNTATSFDYSGMVVTLTYADESTEDVAYGDTIPTLGIKFKDLPLSYGTNGLLVTGDNEVGVRIDVMNVNAYFKVTVVETDVDDYDTLSIDRTYTVPGDGQNHFYVFAPDATGVYNISSSHADIADVHWDPVSCVNGTAGKVRAYFLQAGAKYVLFENGKYEDNVLITKGNMTVIDEGSEQNVSVRSRNDYVYFGFTPDKTAEYTIESIGRLDTYLAVYSDDMEIDNDDNGGVNENFKKTILLVAKKTYLISVKLTKEPFSGTLDFSFSVGEANDEKVMPVILDDNGSYTDSFSLQGNESNNGNDHRWYTYSVKESGLYSLKYSLKDDYIETDYIDIYDDKSNLIYHNERYKSSDEFNSGPYKYFDMTAGDKYYIKVGAEVDRDKTVDAEVILKKVSVTKLTPGTEYSASIKYGGMCNWFSYTPKESGYYTFASLGDYDTKCIMYGGGIRYEDSLAYQDSGGTDDNYEIFGYLKANVTYYFRSGMYFEVYTGDYKAVLSEVTGTVMKDGDTKDISSDDTFKGYYSFTPEKSINYSLSAPGLWIVIYEDGEKIITDNDYINYHLKAGKTYMILLSSYDAMESEFSIKGIPAVKDISVSGNNKNDLYAGLSMLNTNGMSIEVEYDNGEKETLYYGDTSNKTGDGFKVKPVSSTDRLQSVLTEGRHEYVITYMDKTANYQVDVKALSEVPVVEKDVKKPCDAGYFERVFNSFSPDEDGDYMFAARIGTGKNINIAVYDEEGNVVTEGGSKSGQDGAYDIVSLKADSTYYYCLYSDDISMKEDGDHGIETYVIKADNMDIEGEDLTLSSSSDNTKAYIFTVKESGYYEFHLTKEYTEGSVCTADLDIYGNGLTGIVREEGTASNAGVTYSCDDRVYYMEKGTYAVIADIDVDDESAEVPADKVTLSYGKVSAFAKEGYEGITDNRIHFYACKANYNGWFKFITDVTCKDSGESYYYDHVVYDNEGKKTGYSVLSDSYDEDKSEYHYVNTVTGAFKDGAKYLIVARAGTEGLAYKFTHEKEHNIDEDIKVKNIELLANPNIIYYSKLDDFQLEPEYNMNYGSQIRVTYDDGSTEDLDYYSTSEKTGRNYSIYLPDDVPRNKNGSVKTGDYKAILTYCDKQIEVPISVKPIKDMTSFDLDDKGNGNYTGTIENIHAYYGGGYIRFTTPRDGFYKISLSSDMSQYAEDYILFSDIYNSKYKSIYDYSNMGNSDASVYSRAGQSIFVEYYKNFTVNSDNMNYTINVEYEENNNVTELTEGKTETVKKTEDRKYSWYSFTPKTSGTYIFSTENCPYSYALYLFDSPTDIKSISYSYNFCNGDDNMLSYNMEAGKTYYYRVYSQSRDYRVVIVKKTEAESLQLLTEGKIYINGDNINQSISNLRFRVGYSDGTTEDITYGYNGTDRRYFSRQYECMSYTDNFAYSSGGTVKDGEYDIPFNYMGIKCTVKLYVDSIKGTINIDQGLDDTIESENAVSYNFKPAETGYYRFSVSSASGMPDMCMYNDNMNVMPSEVLKEYENDGIYYNTGTYKFEEDAAYVVRIINPEASDMQINCYMEKLEQPAGIKIKTNPQKIYYLGIDTEADPEGYTAEAKYDDGTVETVDALKGGELTGIKPVLTAGLNSDGGLSLSETGDYQYFIMVYMDTWLTAYIDVYDPETLPAVTGSTTGGIANSREKAYAKLVPSVSGFYKITMTPSNESATGVIETVVDSDYNPVVIHNSERTGSKTVYMSKGRNYYIRGSIRNADGEKIAGNYELCFEQVPGITFTTADAVYGYEEGEAYVKAEAEIKKGDQSDTDYTYTYEWYEADSDNAGEDDGNGPHSDPVAIGTGDTYTLPAGKAAGTYDYYCVVTASNKNNSNSIVIDSEKVTVRITPKKVRLTWNGYETRKYDGTASDVTASVNAEDIIEGDVCNAVVNNGNKVHAGMYTATVSLSNGNYALPEAESDIKKQYTIEKESLTATYAGETIYYGTTPALKVEVTGFAGNETADTASGYTAPKIEGSVPTLTGTHTLTPTVKDSDDYKMTAVSGKLVISRRKATEGEEGQFTITGTKNNDGAYIGDITVKANDGYQLSTKEAKNSFTDTEIVVKSDATLPNIFVRDVNTGEIFYKIDTIKRADDVTPTATPTAAPTATATAAPTATATAAPTATSAANPTATATAAPTATSAVNPTATATAAPTATTAVNPTATATAAPTAANPTATPAIQPTTHPADPTGAPGTQPTPAPSQITQPTETKPSGEGTTEQTITTSSELFKGKKGKTVDIGAASSAAGVTFTYSSADKQVATVSNTGKIKFINVGKTTVTITAEAAGFKQVVKTVTVITIPGKVSLDTKRTKKNKDRLIVRWKKMSSVSGYQVAYSTNSKFKGVVYASVNSPSKASKIITKKINKKNSYYVKVRAYVKVDGVKYYGAFSKAKKI